MDTGVAPCAAAACAVRARDGWRCEVGGSAGTFFDLASVTKPMTAVAIARAGIARRRLAELVPEAKGTATEGVTLELLLAHRAGLEAHRTLYDEREPQPAAAKARIGEVLRAVANARRPGLEGPIPDDGFPPVYSDLGYVLAGEALARATGSVDAGEAIAQLVAAPLGLSRSLGTVRELRANGVDCARDAAVTERVAWRGGDVRGAVHDENAWALTGYGGSGHAGMFGTADAVLAFGCAVFDALIGGAEGRFGKGRIDGDWLLAPRRGGTLRAGFDGKSTEASSAGLRASADAFGHLGFTGTSLWIDPEAKAVVVLLTNRVHPTRDRVAIRAARPIAHDALFARAASLVDDA